jgi:hypothetical protein
VDEKSYAKRIRRPDGTLSDRYTAIDPAELATICTCGKAKCTRARLLPFREHVARLYRLLGELMGEGFLGSYSSGWMGVCHGLRLAASIDDIEADTGYVVDAMEFALCEPTINYEDADSEMASKYVAGATIFGFCWQAYESGVKATATGELVRLVKEERYGERGRRLFESRPGLAVHFPGLKDLLLLSLHQCEYGGLFTQRLDRMKARAITDDFVMASELAREFRNFSFHGEDEPPAHENWGSALVSHCRLSRFYNVSRLLLYLVQALAWIEVGDAKDNNHVLETAEGDINVSEALKSVQFKTSGPGVERFS